MMEIRSPYPRTHGVPVSATRNDEMTELSILDQNGLRRQACEQIEALIEGLLNHDELLAVAHLQAALDELRAQMVRAA
jgi:DNA-binding GntR family transcriptional regulator